MTEIRRARAPSPAALAGQMNDIALGQLSDLLRQIEADQQSEELAIEAVLIVLGVLRRHASPMQYRTVLAEALPLLEGLSRDVVDTTARDFSSPN